MSSRTRRGTQCCCADAGSHNEKVLFRETIPCLRRSASRRSAHGMTCGDHASEQRICWTRLGISPTAGMNWPVALSRIISTPVATAK